MSLHYSEYNPSNENLNKENTRGKKGATRKRRCKLGANKIKNLLNSFEGMENESSNLADFNPPPKPELTKIKNQSSDTPKTNTNEAEQNTVTPDQTDNPVQPYDYSTFNNDAANKQYYQQYYNQYVPYYTQAGNQQNIAKDKSQLLDKLNYMINLLEEQKEHKTDNITEELILYMFLGVFVIFVVDSFARAGKYTR